jgi:hypothetical protein
MREIASMGRISQGSAVTIVAASAPGAQHGFLQPRKPPRAAFELPYRTLEGDYCSVYTRPLMKWDEAKEPVN